MIRRFVRSALLPCLAVAAASSSLAGDVAQAARFYEDGLARFGKDDMAGAVIQLKNALQQDHRMLAAHVLLAKALLKQGEYAAAEVAFNEALRLGVSPGEVAIPYGHLLLAMGRPKTLLERLPVDGLPPDRMVEVLALRATALAEDGAIDQALLSTGRARVLAPRSPLPLVAEATILLNDGRVDAARAAASKATEIAPGDAAAWNVRASVDHTAGRIEAALQGYGRALELQPGLADARIARAGVLIDLQRDDEARKDLALLREAGVEDARAAYLHALLAARRGEQKAVADELRSVQTLVNRLPREWLAGRERFLMLGALSNHALGHREAAIEHLDLLLKRFPRNLGARKLLASVLLDAGESARALSTLEPVLQAAPNDPNALYLAGRAHLARKSYTRAQRMLDQAVELGATPEIFRALAQTQLGLGRTEQGFEALRRTNDARPDDLGVAFVLATHYMRRGEAAAARTLMDELARRQPDHPAVINMQGAVSAAAGDLAAARGFLVRAAALAPGFLAPRLNLVRVDRAEGREDQARAALDRLLGETKGDPDVLFELALLEQSRRRYSQAIEPARKALDAEPGNVRFALLLVDLYLAGHRSGDAVDVARMARVRAPGSLDVLDALARAELAHGDRAAALQTYQDMTKLAEFDAPMQVRIGRLNAAAGDLRAAAYNAQKALTAKADFGPAKVLAADLALARGEIDKVRLLAADLQAVPATALEGLRLAADAALAEKDYPRATELARKVQARAPSGANVIALARIRAAAGDGAEASRILDAWLGQHSGDHAVRMSLAERQMAAGDWPAARKSLGLLREALPDEPGVHNNLALALQELGDPAALDVAREANRLAPEDPVVLDTLGWVMARSGQLDVGLRYLRDARLRLPDNPEVRWHLAYALERLGQVDEARRELDQALASGRGFIGAGPARALRGRL